MALERERIRLKGLGLMVAGSGKRDGESDLEGEVGDEGVDDENDEGGVEDESRSVRMCVTI
jgi:hypothetical protein